MPIDYTLGFIPTVCVSIFVATPAVILAIFAITELLKDLLKGEFSFSYNMEVEGINLDISLLGKILLLLSVLLAWLVGAFFYFTIAAGIAVSTLVFLFPIVNFLLQSWWSTEFYSYEIANGALGLRVTSILIAHKAFMSLLMQILTSYQALIHKSSTLKVNKVSYLLNKIIESKVFAKQNLADISGTNELEPLKNQSTVTIIQTFQNVFYICILFSLWFFMIANISSVWSRSASWLLFFIADDWAIISDYYSILKGRILKPHLIRLLVSNLALYLLCSLGYLNKLSLWLSILFIVTCGAILLMELAFMLLGFSVIEKKET